VETDCTEIEITPAMIEAGAAALTLATGEFVSFDDYAASVEAMLAAR
jgi:hypothetical protein